MAVEILRCDLARKDLKPLPAKCPPKLKKLELKYASNELMEFGASHVAELSRLLQISDLHWLHQPEQDRGDKCLELKLSGSPSNTFSY
jgi:hypothetical protein